MRHAADMQPLDDMEAVNDIPRADGGKSRKGWIGNAAAPILASTFFSLANPPPLRHCPNRLSE
jgi:hypothetical protein